MSCAHCEDLEEEVAYLKSELGLVRSKEETIRLRHTFSLSTAEAALVAELYAAKGRTVRHYRLLEALPTDNEDRSPRILNTYICRIRARLAERAQGEEPTIHTIWGDGYRLTAEGQRIVSEAY